MYSHQYEHNHADMDYFRDYDYPGDYYCWEEDFDPRTHWKTAEHDIIPIPELEYGHLMAAILTLKRNGNEGSDAYEALLAERNRRDARMILDFTLPPEENA